MTGFYMKCNIGEKWANLVFLLMILNMHLTAWFVQRPVLQKQCQYKFC